MKSKWFNYKREAIKLRQGGKAYGQIIDRLGVPKSTLSYWFRDVRLTDNQKALIRKKWLKAIVDSRQNAIFWHNEQKRKRLSLAKAEAEEVLSSIDFSDKAILELALALLYLGEGTKKSLNTSLGSSDPQILQFFLGCIQALYGIDNAKLRIDLHLRADQDVKLIKNYWAKTLRVPIETIKGISLDKRTAGRPTYANYKGVCIISCGRVAIQRRLMYISTLYCDQIISQLG